MHTLVNLADPAYLLDEQYLYVGCYRLGGRRKLYTYITLKLY